MIPVKIARALAYLYHAAPARRRARPEEFHVMITRPSSAAQAFDLDDTYAEIAAIERWVNRPRQERER